MIVFVLRHANRRPEPHDGLTTEGRARAERLGWMLEESGVSVAYRTEFVRACQTVKPLERARGGALRVEEIAVNRVPPEPSEIHVQRVAQAVRSEPAEGPLHDWGP